ncbi:MAG: Ku protein [Candidatus Aenigmatarchaeota archaeon]
MGYRYNIQFGLITIPVKVNTLQKDNGIRFNFLCNVCKQKIVYKRYCANCNTEVSYNDLLKGFFLSKNNYVIFTKEELDKLKEEVNDKTINILGFTDANTIPFYLFQKTYNLDPQDDKKTGVIIGEEAYNLFKEALKITNLCAIGSIVFNKKSYLCVIRHYGNRLFLSLLYYPEMIYFSENNREFKIDNEKLKMSVEFIKKITYINFEEFYKNIKDKYRDKFLELLQNKLNAKGIKEEAEEFKKMQKEIFEKSKK